MKSLATSCTLYLFTILPNAYTSVMVYEKGTGPFPHLLVFFAPAHVLLVAAGLLPAQSHPGGLGIQLLRRSGEMLRVDGRQLSGCAMIDNILSTLGLALKAGKAEVGEEPVGAATRAKKARVVLLAQDAAASSVRRAMSFA